MPQTKHIVVIAGEESGDAHAAHFVTELITRFPDLTVSGIGGHHMQTAGVHLVSDLAKHGVTGLTEVFRHLRRFKGALDTIKAHLKTTKPDLLVLVDFPAFNLRLAKYAKRVLGLKIVYYISPQIWAWKANRIHLIRECVDKMAVIFPFEKTLYQNAGVPVAFVGHPLVNKVAALKNQPVPVELPQNKRLIALLPGSRRNEIEHHMPVIRDTAVRLVRDMPDLHFVIPVAETVKTDTIEAYFAGTNVPYTVVHGQAIPVMQACQCVVVASGTASLECALLAKPMCIIYKASLLTYLVATKVIRVNYLGLCNLLKNQMIAPELLQYDCNAQELSRMVNALLTNSHKADRMVDRLEALREELSTQEADTSISEAIAHEAGLI